jgi:hypothetical protein
VLIVLIVLNVLVVLNGMKGADESKLEKNNLTETLIGIGHCTVNLP